MLLLLLPLLALAEAWMHPFHFPWRLHVEQQYEAVVHTPAGSRLALLAVFSLLLMDGHAQVLLLQRPSVNRKRFSTANIECKVEGIDNFRDEYIHWYRHLPDRAPERILYVTSTTQVSYDLDSYKNKYSSYKTENKISFLSILNIRYNDEDGFAQETPIQSPVSVTKSQGNTDLKCHFKDFSGNFDNTVIHWYQQKENEAPVRMIYFSSGTVEVDGSFQRQRYRIQTTSRQKLCTLTIRNVIPEDSATYYCAYWDPHYGIRQQSPQQIFPCQLNHNSLERYHVNSRGVDELLSQKQFHVNLSDNFNICLSLKKNSEKNPC
ncbi:hypothetical protein ASZ78_003484 [Callipepla squamata]|uniref:Ig-like domain-containing protein n=1 Tax=Callipepla squamata TaxID=9009 RepID=A0A226MH80_CALSU|nr:hypothetical protein ASZ78_003484 [Callipepla squamata]